MAKKSWYHCDPCGYLEITEQEAYSQHARFHHTIKKRTPPHTRTIYNLGDEQNFVVNVNGDSWTVTLRLLSFKQDKAERGMEAEKWRFYSSSVLGSNLAEISKKLSSMRPEITESELTQLIQDSIRVGRYDEEHGKQRCAINVCLDSDLQLTPKNAKSRWTTITSSKLTSLIKTG